VGRKKEKRSGKRGRIVDIKGKIIRDRKRGRGYKESY